MKRFDLGAGITLAMIALSGVVWGLRLEGRVDAQEREYKAVVAQLRDDVNYIRARLDQLVGKP
jgi:hypothetical protein